MDVQKRQNKASKMEQIDKLEIRAEKQKRELRITQGKIQEIRDKEIIPALRKKYEGKYFKFNNGYDSKRRWPLYYRIDKITDVRYFSGFAFEDDKEGKIEFRTEKDQSLSFLQTEVIKAEFDRELKKVMRKLAKAVTK